MYGGKVRSEDKMNDAVREKMRSMGVWEYGSMGGREGGREYERE